MRVVLPHNPQTLKPLVGLLTLAAALSFAGCASTGETRRASGHNASSLPKIAVFNAQGVFYGSEANIFTSEVRGVVAQALKGRFAVMDSETILMAVDRLPGGRKCLTDDCMVRIAQEVQADFSLQARVQRGDGRFSLHAVIHKVDTANMLGSSRGPLSDKVNDVVGIKEVIHAALAKADLLEVGTVLLVSDDDAPRGLNLPVYLAGESRALGRFKHGKWQGVLPEGTYTLTVGQAEVSVSVSADEVEKVEVDCEDIGYECETLMSKQEPEDDYRERRSRRYERAYDSWPVYEAPEPPSEPITWAFKWYVGGGMDLWFTRDDTFAFELPLELSFVFGEEHTFETGLYSNFKLMFNEDAPRLSLVDDSSTSMFVGRFAAGVGYTWLEGGRTGFSIVAHVGLLVRAGRCRAWTLTSANYVCAQMAPMDASYNIGGRMRFPLTQVSYLSLGVSTSPLIGVGSEVSYGLGF